MNGILKIRTEVKGKRPMLAKGFLLIKSILFVTILVLGTNWLNKRHSITLQNTMGSVYEDKRIAQYHVYKLNQQFHLKRLRLGVQGKSPQNSIESPTIERLLSDFGALKLTAKESLHFDEIKTKYLMLLDLEESILNDSNESFEKKHLKMNLVLDRIMVGIDDLANISFTERLTLPEKEKKSLNMDKLLLKVEITSFIVIGIIVQLIMLYPRKKGIELIKEPIQKHKD